MRRGAAEPRLAVDPALAPAFAKVAISNRGLRLVPSAPPEGVPTAPARDLILESGAPVALRTGALVNDGALAFGLGALGGVAYSLGLPRVRVIHDRRPPGLDAVVGAAAVNAGLMHADGGWRCVVLPSLGDVAADLGEGPVAVRHDGRMLAVADGEVVIEAALSGDGGQTEHPGPADALAFDGDGTLWAARGGAVGAPGLAAGEGPAVVVLAGAARAGRVAALHEDGSVSVWQAGAGGPVARLDAPVPGAGTLVLSADGERVELGVPTGEAPAAAVVRVADGALERRVEGARVIAESPSREALFVAGDWGSAWLIEPPETKE